MSESWKSCPDCLALIKSIGMKNVQVCDICTHVSSDQIRCACESAEEAQGAIDGLDKND